MNHLDITHSVQIEQCFQGYFGNVTRSLEPSATRRYCSSSYSCCTTSRSRYIGDSCTRYVNKLLESPEGVELSILCVHGVVVALAEVAVEVELQGLIYGKHS